MKLCTYEGCGRELDGKGLCKSHNAQLRRTGILKTIRNPRLKSVKERFWDKVDKVGDSGCWMWLDEPNPAGYGIFWDGTKQVRAHRWAYEQVHGAIPKGLVIDHMCFTRACVNTDHLRLATHKQNMENRQNTWAASGIRGVHWSQQSSQYYGSVIHNGKRYTAGFSTDIEVSAEAAKMLRSKYFTHAQ